MKRFQLFVRGVSTNWIGTMGVALATSSFLLFLFMELMRITGIVTNSYVGLVSYMALPALFILGLVLVPIGWWRYRRATGRTTDELLTQRFPDDMNGSTRPMLVLLYHAVVEGDGVVDQHRPHRLAHVAA